MKRKILSLMLISIVMLFSFSFAESFDTYTNTYYFFHSSGVIHGHGVNKVAEKSGKSLATCCGSGGAKFRGNNNYQKWWDFANCWNEYPTPNDLETIHEVQVPYGATVTSVEPMQDNIYGTRFTQDGTTVRIAFIPGMPVDGIVNGNNQIPKIKDGYGYNMYTTVPEGGLHSSNAPVDNSYSDCPGNSYCSVLHNGNKRVKITYLLNEGGGVGLIFQYKFNISVFTALYTLALLVFIIFRISSNIGFRFS